MSRTRHRGTITAVAAALLVVAAATACSTDRAPAGRAGAGDGSTTAGVRRGDFRQTFLLTGALEAVSGEPVLVPRSPTWRTQIRWIVEDGTVIEEGDPVVELDTTELAGAFDEKRIQVDRTANELARREAEIAGQLAEKRHDRHKARIALAKAELKAAVPAEIQPLRVYQEAQLALERARVTYEKAVADHEAYRVASESEVENLRIDLAKAEREMETAERALDAMVVRAPAAGIVVVGEHPREGRKYQVGDTVWVGLEIAEVPDLSSMRVEASLSDVDDGRIAPGMEATCTLDTYPDRPLRGVVRSIGPIAQESGWRSTRRFFKVGIDLESSDPEIMRPGMSVKVEVETATRRDVALVPRSALDYRGDAVLARLDRGGERAVELGPCNAVDCVLLEGLPEGTLLRARR